MKLTEYIISKIQASVIVVVIIENYKWCIFFGKKHQHFNFFLTILDLRQFMRDARDFAHDPRYAPIRLSQMTQRFSLRLNYYTTFKLILNSLS